MGFEMADDDVAMTVYIDATTKARLDALKESQGIALSKFVELATIERLDRIEAALKEPSRASR